jgi:hypothetical protein
MHCKALTLPVVPSALTSVPLAPILVILLGVDVVAGAEEASMIASAEVADVADSGTAEAVEVDEVAVEDSTVVAEVVGAADLQIEVG